MGEECLKSIITTSEDRKLVVASVGDGYIRFNSRRDFSDSLVGEECLKSIITTSEDRKLVVAPVGGGYIRFNSRRDFSAETFQSVCGGVKRLRDKVGKTKPDGSKAGHPILF